MTIVASIVWHSCDWLVDLQSKHALHQVQTLCGVQMLVTLQSSRCPERFCKRYVLWCWHHHIFQQDFA